jgi:hypothetical protein
MLELLCRIPEHFGWMAVGSLATVCLILAGSIIIKVVKDRLSPTEENDD